MEKYKVKSLDQINGPLVAKLVQKYKATEVPRINKLLNYYVGQAEVKNRVMSDKSKPNNKIANPFGSYITDTVLGYWLGKPITYTGQDEQFLEKIQYIYKDNHEQDHNSELGKLMTITGLSYELLYLNERSELRMAIVSPAEAFFIYDSTIEEKPLMAVRFFDIENYDTGEIETQLELYTDNYIQYGTMKKKTCSLSAELYPHNFGSIPLVQYRNNDEMTGSFEKVVDLINSYDLAVSDTSNNLEYFADAYLALSGMEDTEPEDILAMKENRVMILAEGGKAEWLVKGTSSIEVEEFKDRLKEDIFTLSQVPDLSDDSFGNSASGISLQYKLFGLENLVSITERKFKASLERRIELICDVLNLKGGNHNHHDIQMTFTRNIPANLTTQADIISKLNGLVSKETLLSLLPFVEDPALEITKLEGEQEDSLAYSGLFNEEGAVMDGEQV